MTKLAVMMAAYNAESFIVPALRSIFSQASADITLDVIVVDDGSTDQTGQILDAMAAEDARMRVIHTANQGVTRARNEALSALAADTDLVTFLDADDLVPQGRYERDIKLLLEQPALQLTFGNSIWFREADDEQKAPAANAQTFSGRSVQLGAGTYRYSLIKAVGGFDTSFKQAEDMDFLLRLFELSPTYLTINEPSLYYRRHDNNMTHDLTQVKRDFSRALMMSMRRRKKDSGFRYPDGLFDVQGVMEAFQW